MSAGAQSENCTVAILKSQQGEATMMFVQPRCNNAGPLGKPIHTRTLVALLARLPLFARIRW
jgi:hypothetical protein